ncbi:formate dehydrogenase subunit gamma [Bosea sp. SSUT16]|uniref:Formate dehydrogenase subunit gamma n=1 Tax=Bosea spartocytisi TaxID=2773451 RepID=A0A927E4L9_9HYPH|nr:formate dehydrogenase subunit gamma [Bosea spartocytisi]MBD3844713.1 formate dehydrogenase subunit gamma [Bosea spartocytisi]MCT4470915.1 formate dehydrogenase subunit gamma [Bosea spartocytisi]
MVVRREEERTTVDRYPGRVRVNHWVTAISLILLALSGAALFHPSLFFLSGLFGGGANTRALHPWIGVVLLASFAILFVQMVRYNFWQKVDTQWMRHIGEVMSGHEENLPEIGKYNGAQKIVFWLMTLLILVLFGTGIMIWYEYFGASFTIEQQRFGHILHALAAIAMLLVVIVHIYAGFYVRGTMNAMTEGKVTGGWAFRHHRLWLRQEAREGVIDERQTPPRRHTVGPAE